MYAYVLTLTFLSLSLPVLPSLSLGNVATILAFLCAIFNSLGLAPEDQVAPYLYTLCVVYILYTYIHLYPIGSATGIGPQGFGPNQNLC